LSHGLQDPFPLLLQLFRNPFGAPVYHEMNLSSVLGKQ
jgi:hypothetical protein